MFLLDEALLSNGVHLTVFSFFSLEVSNDYISPSQSAATKHNFSLTSRTTLFGSCRARCQWYVSGRHQQDSTSTTTATATSGPALSLVFPPDDPRLMVKGSASLALSSRCVERHELDLRYLLAVRLRV